MSDVHQHHVSTVLTTVLATVALPTPWLVQHLDDIAKIVTILYSLSGTTWILWQFYKNRD